MKQLDQKTCQREQPLDDDINDERMGEGAKAWMKERLEDEMALIKRRKGHAIPLRVKNCGVVVEEHQGKKGCVVAVNRIEIDTGFDFNKIRQVRPFGQTCRPCGWKHDMATNLESFRS